jgi:hypothetical protein
MPCGAWDSVPAACCICAPSVRPVVVRRCGRRDGRGGRAVGKGPRSQGRSAARPPKRLGIFERTRRAHTTHPQPYRIAHGCNQPPRLCTKGPPAAWSHAFVPEWPCLLPCRVGLPSGARCRPWMAVNATVAGRSSPQPVRTKSLRSRAHPLPLVADPLAAPVRVRRDAIAEACAGMDAVVRGLRGCGLQMWAGCAESRCRCGRGRAQSRCRRGRGASPVPVQTWQGASPVPVQTWQGASPVPVQTWQGASPVLMLTQMCVPE